MKFPSHLSVVVNDCRPARDQGNLLYKKSFQLPQKAF